MYHFQEFLILRDKCPQSKTQPLEAIMAILALVAAVAVAMGCTISININKTCGDHSPMAQESLSAKGQIEQGKAISEPANTISK